MRHMFLLLVVYGPVTVIGSVLGIGIVLVYAGVGWPIGLGAAAALLSPTRVGLPDGGCHFSVLNIA